MKLQCIFKCCIFEGHLFSCYILMSAAMKSQIVTKESVVMEIDWDTWTWVCVLCSDHGKLNLPRPVCSSANDLTTGWQNLNLLSHPNATLAPHAWQARVSGENLNYSLSRYSDILSMIIALSILYDWKIFHQKLFWSVQTLGRWWQYLQ